MRFIKTVKKYVSGSDKFFDIYETDYTNLREGKDAKNRKTISVDVGDKTYTGLYNKTVWEILNRNPNGFLVLWKSPKGDYMLAYSGDLWSDYLTGIDTPHEEAPEDTNTGLSFVYLWFKPDTKSTPNMYLGYHTGSPDDGYVGSNENFLLDYSQDPSKWHRAILGYGSTKEMYILESSLLMHLNVVESPLFYNLSNNLRA